MLLEIKLRNCEIKFILVLYHLLAERLFVLVFVTKCNKLQDIYAINFNQKVFFILYSSEKVKNCYPFNYWINFDSIFDLWFKIYINKNMRAFI